ncbi:hypothetical protein SKAU_G00100310 [Synaphobranchus kaupii]|uniref:Lactase-like protein n=1 Tax=Synaphobranchus kaupii TaxID=118154 RepID=A0A9Q1FZ86_SYNKA|nr:hypothetical protein SKAU_G00100310 [Synaphobranchus kaupii]
MLVLCLSAAEDFDWAKNGRNPFHYGSFPTGFSWGASSSAYQTEGAWDTDAKGVRNWESFFHKKGKIFHNDDGDSSYEEYCKVKVNDSNISLYYYCFSLSWARIIPTGRMADHVKEKGMKCHDASSNLLLENRITPVVTLYHWDLPQSPAGDQTREHVPGLRLSGIGACKGAHHTQKAQAMVWPSYDASWCSAQKGVVGGEPVDARILRNIEAAQRCTLIPMGWFALAVFHGYYPQVMKYYIERKSVQQGLVGSWLPAFSFQEKSYIKGISNFTTLYAAENFPPGCQGGYFSDRDRVDPRWPESVSEWLSSVPWRFRHLLNFVKTQIGSLRIYLTENMVKTTCTELCDEWMMQYFRDYINKMLKDGQLETEDDRDLLLLQSASSCRGQKGMRRNSKDLADAQQNTAPPAMPRPRPRYPGLSETCFGEKARLLNQDLGLEEEGTAARLLVLSLKGVVPE